MNKGAIGGIVAAAAAVAVLYWAYTKYTANQAATAANNAQAQAAAVNNSYLTQAVQAGETASLLQQLGIGNPESLINTGSINGIAPSAPVTTAPASSNASTASGLS